MSDHQPKPPSAPAVMPATPATGAEATSARETFSPAVEQTRVNDAREEKRHSDSTFVGEVHGKRRAAVSARDEPLVSELGYSVEGVEDDVVREVPDTGAVHDQEGVSFAAVELPLCFEGCAREAGDATVCKYVGFDQMGISLYERTIRTRSVPGASLPVLHPWRR